MWSRVIYRGGRSNALGGLRDAWFWLCMLDFRLIIESEREREKERREKRVVLLRSTYEQIDLRLANVHYNERTNDMKASFIRKFGETHGLNLFCFFFLL